MDLTVAVEREGPGYWARVVELPGCFASGRSLDELREALGEAIGLYEWDTPIDLAGQKLQIGEVRLTVAAPGS